MIFTSASASGYDENITLIGITAEKGEVIRVGDTITIPMNDHTFEQREIIDMYRDWKKWKKGKDLFSEIKEGEQVVASHISSKYLQGILIGYVSEITTDANNLTRSGYITPAVDFQHLQEVLVITTTKEEMLEKEE